MGSAGILLMFVSRGSGRPFGAGGYSELAGGCVPGGSVEKALVSVGDKPGIKLHGTVGSVPAMKNSVASTPGHPGTHCEFVTKSTVDVMMPAGLGQSGGAGLRR